MEVQPFRELGAEGKDFSPDVWGLSHKLLSHSSQREGVSGIMPFSGDQRINPNRTYLKWRDSTIAELFKDWNFWAVFCDSDSHKGVFAIQGYVTRKL